MEQNGREQGKQRGQLLKLGEWSGMAESEAGNSDEEHLHHRENTR